MEFSGLAGIFFRCWGNWRHDRYAQSKRYGHSILVRLSCGGGHAEPGVLRAEMRLEGLPQKINIYSKIITIGINIEMWRMGFRLENE
jgi:hypothetical protein